MNPVTFRSLINTKIRVPAGAAAPNTNPASGIARRRELLSTRSASVDIVPSCGTTSLTSFPSSGKIQGEHEGEAPPVQTVIRAANVLLSFQPGERWLGVSEIARRLALPKSVVHRSLAALLATGLVTRDPGSRRYGLGPRASDVGLAALGNTDTRGVALPFLEDLGARTRETVALSLLVGRERFFAAQAESPQAVRMTVPIGRRWPLYAGASGRAILAEFSSLRLAAYFASTVMVKLTSATLVDREALERLLAETRVAGWNYSSGEADRWAASVSAPIFFGREVIGSVSLCGPRERVTREKARALGGMVRATANNISAHLGV
jgi:IclR family transcriptional regulator, acetate operon repressor